ncbi:MAG: isoprenylcysteine carboxylmethyltransferase family protein [Candidatus Atribacteria bacterium]|nr:isoprenylcysteine carboxylmethyltransferase family protein [Candidatus Atribacteria bacterium]
MSLVPVFEIGVWNVWIFMLYYILTLPAMRLISKAALQKSDVEAPKHLYSNTEKRIVSFYQNSFILMFLYSIFLPLKLGTSWFYIGLPICLIGLILFTISFFNFTTTPLGEPLNQGLYRYSRHPVYITQTLLFIGVGIASASWIFLLFTVLRTIASFKLMPAEERFCLEKYGDAYREYMNKTTRWIGIPKSGKLK